MIKEKKSLKSWLSGTVNVRYLASLVISVLLAFVIGGVILRLTGFDPFEAFFGGSYGYSRAGYGSGAQAPDQDTRMQAARNYINARHYTEAMHVLESIPISERRARWYYYAALASSGLGNRVNALEYAKKAVELEPGNYEYQNLLDRLQNYSRNYRNMNSGYTTQSFGVWRICLPWLLLSFFCRCFPCFCYF